MGGSKHYNARARRWFVSVYWQKKQYTIWKYKGEPMFAEQTAEKALNKIRGEVDDGTFNPKAWLPDSPLSIREYSKQWLDSTQACKNTRRVYRSSIKRAIDFFGPDQDIRHITHSKLLLLYKSLPLSEKGRYNVLSALRTMLRAAYKDELLKRVPPFPRLSMGLPQEIKYLSLEQQNTVLQAIPERHRGVFEFGMIYGLRIGEIRALKWDAFTDKEFTVKRAFSDNYLAERTKTGEIRVYGLTHNAMSILQKAKLVTPFSGFVFAKNRRGTAYRGEDLNKIWKTACNQVGISMKLYNGIRHSRASQLLDAGYGYQVCADVLGHKSADHTRNRYCKRSRAQITEILEGMGKVIPIDKENGRGGPI